jgi:type II pantothenate kinase
MRREEKRRLGIMFLLRYLRSLLRHYEEGFWLVVLAVLNSVPGARALGRKLGLVSLAEDRAASMAMCGNFKAHDVALSLLRMVSNNIGHVATLSAQQVTAPQPRALPHPLSSPNPVFFNINYAAGGLLYARSPLHHRCL